MRVPHPRPPPPTRPPTHPTHPPTRLGKRIKNEVHSRVLTLVFSLLAILVAGAGFFFELETSYSDQYPDLTFMRSLYWSAVTLTTVGGWWLGGGGRRISWVVYVRGRVLAYVCSKFSPLRQPPHSSDPKLSKPPQTKI